LRGERTRDADSTGKGKGRTLVIAPLCRHGPPQRRSGTWRAPSSVAHTCLIPSQPKPVLIYRPRKDGGLSKPRPRVQRATGPRLLRDRLRPAGLELRSRDRYSSTLTTRLSRHSEEDSVSISLATQRHATQRAAVMEIGLYSSADHTVAPYSPFWRNRMPTNQRQNRNRPIFIIHRVPKKTKPPKPWMAVTLSNLNRF